MEPWQSWALVGAVGAGAYFYYANTSNPTRGRRLKPNEIAQAQRRSSNANSESNRRQNKGKKPDSKDRNAGDVADVSSASAATSGNEKAQKKKADKKRQPSKLGQSSAVEFEPSAETGMASEPEDESMDNQEFAKQMAGLKVGSSLAKPSTASETKKTKKQGKRNAAIELPSNGKAVEPTGGAGSQELSTTSSTTGADADDDLSPAISPALHGSDSTPNAGGVSDMLEAPAKGPSILRVTSPAEPQPDHQPKQKKAAPEPETKKQRQRRQKNEAEKAARAEAEKQRRELMEKQRRTAREAEGRPAKNGLGSAPPTTNVWSKPAGSVESKAPAAVPVSNANGPLLDTFEENPQASLRSGATEANGSTANRNPVEQEIPSEEEQMKMLSEIDDDDGWNTVVKGGKAKKKNKAPIHGVETESSAAGVNMNDNGQVNGGVSSERKRPTAIKVGGSKAKGPPSPMIGVVPPKPRTTNEPIDPKVWNRSNIHLHPDYDPEYPYALTGHPDDSDWAVV